MPAAPLHVITNLAKRGGAEAMLTRYLQRSAIKGQKIVSVLEAQPDRWGLCAESSSVRELRGRGVLGLMRAVLELRRIVREERPSVVLCWLYHAHFAGSLAVRLSGLDIPVYWNIRGCLRDGTGARALARGTALTVALTKALRLKPALALSNSARALAQHQEAGYINAGGIVIPNGVSLPDSPRIPSETPRVVGIVGRLNRAKDYPTFFRAASLVAREVPEARFVVAGRDMEPANPAVRDMVRAAGVPEERLSLLGEQEDLTNVYRSLDLLVLSSRSEGFPNVLAEAMSHGVPCVTTDVGDAAQIVGDRTRVVPPRDPAQLAAAIVRLLRAPPAEHRLLAREARARVERHYGIDAAVAAYDALLEPDQSAEAALRRLSSFTKQEALVDS